MHLSRDFKVSIGYSFFYPDENYEQIRAEIKRGLDPIYKHVDVIHAVDGRYINYEHPKDYSTSYAYEVLQEYPNVVIDKVKPSFQTEKRQRCLDMAGEDNMDYMIVWDTDDILYPTPECQRWDFFYKSLKRYSKRYPEYRLFKMKAWIPSSKIWRKAYNAVGDNQWNPYIRIHKDPGTMRYCLWCHYWWAPKDASDEDLVLQKRGMFISDHTIDGVRITTNSLLRGEKQLDTRDNWAWNNDCEEKRRIYIFQNKLMYCEDKNRPDWMTTDFDGYWRYDKDGRPISKICEEDGTLVH